MLARTPRIFLGIAFILLATATMLGATGAHFLADRLTPDRLEVFEQAVQFQFFQALGLIAIAGLAHKLPESRAIKVAGWLVIAGIGFFSGSIYATTAGAPRSIDFIAMVGGSSFQIAGLTMAAVVLFGKAARA